MADPKIINLTKVVDGKTNRITVTDTDGDFSANVATGSIMGFDKNDKVVVKGDISVFTQDEIRNAFFKGYNATDVRTDAEMKDVKNTNLQVKEGKITGDTSKAFRLEDLEKVTKPVEKATASSATSTAAPGVPTVSTTAGAWQLTSSQTAPTLPAAPSINPQLTYASANLIGLVSNFLGGALSSNFGQPSYYMSGNVNMNSLTELAKYVWGSIPVQPQANPFSTSQTPSTPATAAGTTPAAATTPAAGTTPATATPATTSTSNTATKDNGAVVSEGEIKDETAKKDKKSESAGERLIKGGVALANAKIKAEKAAKAKKEKAQKGNYDGKNIYGQDLKKYYDKEGNRIVEKYENGKLVEKDTFTHKHLGAIEYDHERKVKFFGKSQSLETRMNKKTMDSYVQQADATRVAKPIVR